MPSNSRDDRDARHDHDYDSRLFDGDKGARARMPDLVRASYVAGSKVLKRNLSSRASPSAALFRAFSLYRSKNRVCARAHLAHASPTTCSSPTRQRSVDRQASCRPSRFPYISRRSLARASQPSRYSRCPREYNVREGLIVWELIESRCGNDIGIGIGIDKRSNFPRDHRRDVDTHEIRVSYEIHV